MNHRSVTRSTGLALVLCLLAAAVAAERTLTPHDVIALEEVREMALSPDGKAVAYVLSVPRRPGEDDDGPAWAELHVVRPGSDPKRFVTGQVSVSQVGWTADGSKITFLTKRDDDYTALYAIPLNGGEARRIAKLGSDVAAYDLCSDGQRLALVGREAEDEKLEKLREQGFNQKIYEEDWRPSRVWVARLEGGVEASPETYLDVEGSVDDAVWSPSCDRLALRVTPTPLVDDQLMRSRIRIVDPASGEVRARIDNPGKLGDYAWSEDGRHLGLIAGENENDPREGRLTVVSSEGGPLRDLLPGLEAHVVAFAWKGSDKLVYLVQEGTEAYLGEIGADGTGKSTRLAKGGPIFGDLSLAPSGDLALRGSTPSHPNEVFHLAAGNGSPKRTTFSNPWLADVRLAKQEVVRYKARDGLELEGLLIRPLDEKPGQRYPLVLIVHGGPEAHFSNGWLTSYSRPGQVVAGRGYAAFYPNYRASTGRGVEFSKLDHGDPAGKEFDDLVDGVDHLIEMGLVDRDKVAITGGSYGGYATAWGATYYTERFAAAVMSVGISEKIAKFGTSDIPTELYLVHERKWPWDDFQHALERSPVYYAKQARTPILIAHGEKDTRVYPGQSHTLYRFLKQIGKTPVRLVLYPEEGHGNRKAAARLDFSLRQLRWFDHYLLGEGGEPPSWEIDYQLTSDGKTVDEKPED